MFELARKSDVPLVDQIVERFTQLVRRGQLPDGARVPSIRKLAKLIGVSPFTVVDAYDRLVARGVIESRAGRGFFVAKRRVSLPALPVIEAMPDPGTDAIAFARASLSNAGQIIAAGSGFLPSAWYAEAMPANVWRRVTHARRPQAWLPCPPQGMGELREQLAERLVQRGIAAGPANIVTTFGASQAFDLLARILFAPGDTVLVEDPGYFVLFEQLRARHVKLFRCRGVRTGRTSKRSKPPAARIARAHSSRRRCSTTPPARTPSPRCATGCSRSRKRTASCSSKTMCTASCMKVPPYGWPRSMACAMSSTSAASPSSSALPCASVTSQRMRASSRSSSSRRCSRCCPVPR